MGTVPSSVAAEHRAGERDRPRSPGASRRGTGWLRGGPTGNEQLTAITGAILLVLLAALGVTILRIGQLISEHLFLGLLLLGPVGLKMASTGYRFLRYYIGRIEYVRRGPPAIWLRVLAPAVVLSTLAVFATGVVLMFVGPAHRDPWLLLHKVTFFAWLGATGLHVLGHLAEMPGALRAEMPGALRAEARDGGTLGDERAGRAGRLLTLAGAVVAGAVLAIALIPDFSSWTTGVALLHHGH